jgi:hypothetical protein
MSTVVNDRDNIIRGTSVRKVASSTSTLLLTPSSSTFNVNQSNASTPSTITVKVSAVLVEGPFTFSVQGATLSNVTATTADVAYSTLSGLSAVITVQAANAGAPISTSCILGVVKDGANGTNGSAGARGAGTYYATGSSWSDIVASAATPNSTPVNNDVVTISNGTTYALTKKFNGSSWNPIGAVFDGSLFVTGSIQSAAIDTRGLTVKDNAGNVILGVGNSLAEAYVPTSAQNSQLVPSIQAAALSSFSPYATWDFSNNNGSWYGENSTTVTFNSSSLVVTATNTDPMIAHDWLSINGAVYNKIRARIRRTAGSGWDGIFYYSNSQHGEDGAYRKIISDPTGGVNNTWVVAEWDMTTSTIPADWANYPIQHVRIDFGSTASDVFEIDWISIGRYGVNSDELNAGITAASTAASNAQTDATNALNQLTNIVSDSILSKGEKPSVEKEWDTIYNERGGIVTQATSLSVDSSDYSSKFVALQSYLAALSGWGNHSVDTSIDPAVFKSNFTDYYNSRQSLLNAIAAKAATISTWAGVSGTGRPADNATVGAVAGSNLKDASGNVVGNSDFLNSYLPAGSNLCYNADFSNGLDGWSWASSANIGVFYSNASHPDGAGNGWAVNNGFGLGATTLQVHQTDASASPAYVDVVSDFIPVVIGKRYCVSAYTGAHRCKVDVFIYGYDINSNNIWSSGADADYNDELLSGGQLLTGYKRHQRVFDVPSGVASVRACLRKFATKSGYSSDSWMMVAQVQVEQTGAAATTAGAWNPPSPTSAIYQNIADSKAAIAAISSDNVLSKGEKPAANAQWTTIYNERAGLQNQAGSLGVDSADYRAKYDTLEAYLTSLGTGFTDYSTDSSISGATFATNFTNYYLAKQALINAMAAKAATLASWASVADRPQDTTNLVVKSFFEDGTTGNWKDGSGGSLAIVAVSGQAFTKALQFAARDQLEFGSGFPVVPGETLYVEAWLDASTCNTNVNFGMECHNAAGAVVTGGWLPTVTVAQGVGWTHVTGSVTVPASSVVAYPWLQINGFSNLGTGRAAGLRITRYQPGATVGATLGTNVNGSMANVKDYATNLGTFVSSGTARTQISDVGIRVYDSSNNLRIKIGQL